MEHWLSLGNLCPKYDVELWLIRVIDRNMSIMSILRSAQSIGAAPVILDHLAQIAVN